MFEYELACDELGKEGLLISDNKNIIICTRNIHQNKLHKSKIHFLL